jgi:hypothetical protein
MHLRHCRHILMLMAALVTAAGVPALRGQTLPSLIRSSLDEQRQGLKIYGLTVASGYYSAILPGLGSQPVVPNSLVLGSDVSNSMTAAIGYRWLKPTSNFEIIYTPTYFGNVRNSQFNSFNHALSITGARPLRLGQHLTLSFNVQGGVSDSRGFLFSPGVLDSIAQTPATFQDLSMTALGGQMTNNQIASMLTGSSAVASPAQFLFYGDKMLTATLSSTLMYSYSPRLSIGVTVGATRYQHLSQRLPGEGTRPSFLLPQTTSGMVDVRMAYALSPRTQVGADIGTSRNFSRFQQGFSSTGNLFIRRKMGRRWFVNGNAGVGMINTIGGKYNSAAQPQYLLGGMLGFKTYAHIFTTSAQRTITNAFGVIYTASDVNGTWIWRPGERNWVISTQGGYEKLVNPATSRINSWRAMTSFGHSIGHHMTAAAGLVYMTYSGRFSGLPYDFTQRGVQLSLTWVPSNVVQ